MMIYKYSLDPSHATVLRMPQGAQVLTAQAQNGEVCLWAKVDPTQPDEARTFIVYGTGHTVPDNPHLVYVATCQLALGYLVWHIFEQT